VRRFWIRSQQLPKRAAATGLPQLGKRGRNPNGCRCQHQRPPFAPCSSSQQPRPLARPEERASWAGIPLAALPFQLQGRAGRVSSGHPTPALRPLPFGQGALGNRRASEALRRCTDPANHCRMSRRGLPRAPSTPPPSLRCEYQAPGSGGIGAAAISQSMVNQARIADGPAALEAGLRAPGTAVTARYLKSTATLSPALNGHRCQFQSTCSGLQADRFPGSRCLPAFKGGGSQHKARRRWGRDHHSLDCRIGERASKSLNPGNSARRQALQGGARARFARGHRSVPGRHRRAGGEPFRQTQRRPRDLERRRSCSHAAASKGARAAQASRSPRCIKVSACDRFAPGGLEARQPFTETSRSVLAAGLISIT